jgi:acetyltransferase-like isoleucine patch superfamily enzyme
MTINNLQLLFVYILKIAKRGKLKILKPFDQIFTYIILYSNGVKFSSFRSYGLPNFNITLGGKCNIGNGFKINNRESSNPIGRFHACSIFIGKKGQLIIGKNVGMSSAAIVCYEKIEIGDNVNLGGNVVIYDTDFHSLNPQDRLNRISDIARTKPIKIGNNVFIGAHTTILKGVSIGDNSIIGACSVVTKNIPSNEIWAGNPAKFIRIQQ